MGLVDEVEALVPVRDVYFFGHSNGGFMSFRMACDAAERITAIANLAGSTFDDGADCAATEPVSVLGIHGTADDVVFYDGRAASAEPISGYPSAIEAVERFAARADCDLDAVEAGAPKDLDTSIDGAETTVDRYRTGCVGGVDAELWTIEGGAHLPQITVPDFSRDVVRWLLAHRK